MAARASSFSSHSLQSRPMAPGWRRWRRPRPPPAARRHGSRASGGRTSRAGSRRPAPAPNAVQPARIRLPRTPACRPRTVRRALPGDSPPPAAPARATPRARERAGPRGAPKRAGCAPPPPRWVRAARAPGAPRDAAPAPLRRPPGGSLHRWARWTRRPASVLPCRAPGAARRPAPPRPGPARCHSADRRLRGSARAARPGSPIVPHRPR